jgi:large subunit ribosomal protein L25
MDKVVIEATRRTVTGKKVGALRRSGKLPAVLYGHHIDPTPVTLDLREASHVLAGATRTSLITIQLDGNEHATLVREKQRDFIRGTLLHVDFQVVSLTERIRAGVAIELDGVSPAVKDFNGTVVTPLSELEVECLPQDLPERITVDISGLTGIGDSLLVSDIVLSDKVEVLTDPDEVVVVITAAAAEEVVEEAELEEEPEVIERGRKEEEEEEESGKED